MDPPPPFVTLFNVVLTTVRNASLNPPPPSSIYMVMTEIADEVAGQRPSQKRSVRQDADRGYAACSAVSDER